MTCHCLIIDGSTLAKDGDDHAHLAHACSTIRDRDALRAYILTWLPPLHDSSVATVIAEPLHRRIHIHFTSQAALAAALLSTTQLVRCDSIASVRWGQRARVCDMKRHQLPEMLQLTCIPSEPIDPSKLDASRDALLRVVGLEHAVHWSPRKHDAMRLQLNVLPRDIDPVRLATLIARVHNQHRWMGGLVQVHAPNSPALIRCHQCKLLGHDANHCPQYEGVGIRCLFTKKLPYATMQQLQQLTRAD